MFTHLRHEHSYKYLISAKKVIKDTGKIVFSFLTFNNKYHWALFDQMIHAEGNKPHNQFVTNEQIEIWAKRLGLNIELFETGSKPYIPIKHPVQLGEGARFTDFGSLGQGVCVLTKIT